MKFRWMNMMLSLGLSATLLLSVAAMPAAAHAEKGHHTREHKACLSPKAVTLVQQLQKLWIEHALWTKNFVVSSLEGLADKDQQLARLLRNQQDIGNAIKPYYGEEAGNKLAKLLTEHIVTAGKVVGAMVSGNESDLQKYNKEWYANADEIAAFLSSLNPNWDQNQLKDMLHMHLQLLTEDVAAYHQKEWEKSIQLFDKNEDHLIQLANVLAEGILKQFPNQFK
ncbi:hypothetical protein [Paenibacillus gorillae]|uniref:hypothetical protein n=1 Tax=Paenibacillus gorillae TaxID=1243662 RepID=UPI0004B96455|nr:hypothetical protein [Paenibacillus gorillae]